MSDQDGAGKACQREELYMHSFLRKCKGHKMIGLVRMVLVTVGVKSELLPSKAGNFVNMIEANKWS